MFVEKVRGRAAVPQNKPLDLSEFYLTLYF